MQHGLDGDGTRAFGRSVVHHRHGRRHRPHLLRQHIVPDAVMGDLKEIDFAQQVHRTGKSVLEIPGQVAQVHEFELAGAQQVAQALTVLAAVLWLRLEGRAQGIGAGIGERGGQELTVGGHDDEFDSVQRAAVRPA